MPTKPPASVGDSLAEIDTPTLVVDLDVMEANIRLMAEKVSRAGRTLRPHAKAYKCAEIAAIQLRHGAVGVCCQKVAEAEALMARGVRDVLVTNEIISPSKLDRLAVLARQGPVAACVDSLDGITLLSHAAAKQRVSIRVLVEIDVGQARCGVPPGLAAVELAQAVVATPNLMFGGLQAYHGKSQHFRTSAERKSSSAAVAQSVKDTIALLREGGIPCATVSGGGTGSCDEDLRHDAITEIQAGSYIFMDADYADNRETGDASSTFRQSLFVKAGVISNPAADRIVIDAGLKALSTDSGMPRLRDYPDLVYGRGGDEHGILIAPRIGERIRLGAAVWLVPSHCDTTVNLYDWIVAIRGNTVENVWALEGRGAVT
jgi:3-hydroxy-D-aspartate aldolase